jgi:hypothetical protein
MSILLPTYTKRSFSTGDTGIAHMEGVGIELPATMAPGFLSLPEEYRTSCLTCHEIFVTTNIGVYLMENCTEIGERGKERNTGKGTIGEDVILKGKDTVGSHLRIEKGNMTSIEAEKEEEIETEEEKDVILIGTEKKDTTLIETEKGKGDISDWQGGFPPAVISVLLICKEISKTLECSGYQQKPQF